MSIRNELSWLVEQPHETSYTSPLWSLLRQGKKVAAYYVYRDDKGRFWTAARVGPYMSLEEAQVRLEEAYVESLRTGILDAVDGEPVDEEDAPEMGSAGET